jgi:phytoene desaturase
MTKSRAIVIGSGFGGLALAIRLQASGVQTTVVEKRDKPGGRAYVYEDEGFTFDAGPTVLTAPNAIEELFQLAGRDMSDYVELLPVMPFYRLCWEDGYSFDYSHDLEATNAQMAKKSPADVDGYAQFLKYAEEVFQQGYANLAHEPFLDFWSMMRVAPQLMRLESYRSVYSMVSKFISDPQLRQVYSFHSLLVGGNPFKTSSIYTLIHVLERKWGVFFPKGGTGALVGALVQLLTDLGGEIRLGAPVERIITKNGRVTGVAALDGWTGEADIVASNADVVHTYRTLLEREPRADSTTSSLLRKRYSMSLFVIYFGTRTRHPDLAHHTVLFGPRYRGLLEDIFEHGVLSDDFSLYLHAPTITDPSLAPPSGEAFYVLSPVPHLGKASIDWETEGPRYRDRIFEYLEQRYIPNLSQDLVTSRIFTPVDFAGELNAHLGSAFSLEPVLTQSAWFRVHNRDSKIGGLYFVGAGTHPGAGVPGVVASARATGDLILGDLGVRTSERKH